MTTEQRAVSLQGQRTEVDSGVDSWSRLTHTSTQARSRHAHTGLPGLWKPERTALRGSSRPPPPTPSDGGDRDRFSSTHRNVCRTPPGSRPGRKIRSPNKKAAYPFQLEPSKAKRLQCKTTGVKSNLRTTCHLSSQDRKNGLLEVIFLRCMGVGWGTEANTAAVSGRRPPALPPSTPPCEGQKPSCFSPESQM